MLTGTFINVGTVLLGTLIGTLLGSRLPAGIQERVMTGLGLVTLVLGIDNALQWRDTNPLIVFGAVLLGGLVGEAIGIERGLGQLGDAIQAQRVPRRPLADVGGVRDRVAAVLRRAADRAGVDPGRADGRLPDARIEGDARRVRRRSRSPPPWDGGSALAAVTVLVYQGGISLAAGLFEHVLAKGSEPLAALVSAGGILIIGISLKLLGVKDVKVGTSSRRSCWRP